MMAADTEEMDAVFEIGGWTLLLVPESEEIVLQFSGDSGSIDVPLTVPNARELVSGIMRMIAAMEAARS